MPENSKQKEGIESEHDAGELGNKRKGSNLGAMLKNPNQNKGIESEHDVGDPETKGRDRIWAQYQRTRNKRRDRTCPKAQRKGYAPV